jgi:hypothetical protein
MYINGPSAMELVQSTAEVTVNYYAAPPAPSVTVVTTVRW